jgi:Zn-dependent protease
VLAQLAAMNLGLMFFNLLPVPPLDGGAVLAGLLPRRYLPMLQPLERYGGLILLALVFTPAIQVVMMPARFLMQQWFNVVGSFIG